MFFRVIIRKKSDDKVAISGDKNEVVKDRTTRYNYELQLTATEEKIINYLKLHQSITNRQAREVSGLSPSGIRKVFDGLVQKKVIVAIGDKKSRSYKLEVSLQV